MVGEAVAGPLAGLDARSGTFGFSDAAYVFDEAGKGQKAIKVQRTDGNLGPIELIVTYLRPMPLLEWISQASR